MHIRCVFVSEQRVRWRFFRGVNPRPSILLHACLVSDKLLAQLIDKESLAFQQEKKNIKVLAELFSEVALFKDGSDVF